MVLKKLLDINLFPSFEHGCVYDNNFINMESYEEVILSITPGYMENTSQFYGLGKKIKNAKKNRFTFSEVVNLQQKMIQVYN